MDNSLGGLNDVRRRRFLRGAFHDAGLHRLHRRMILARNHCRAPRLIAKLPAYAGATTVRKLIAFDEDTFDKLKQLGRDRMATLQELADEAFADLFKKHGIPVDLKDALRKSASLSATPVRTA